MKATPIIVASGESPRTAIALRAAGDAFPGCEAVRVRTLDEALAVTAGQHSALLIAIDSPAGDWERAAGALDEARLPRWGIVVPRSGIHPPEVDSVPDSAWEPVMLAWAFQSAIEKLHLRRSIARLRGDLLTVGVRVVHDLRSPLGGIVSCSEALSESLVDLPAAQKTLFKAVQDSSEELSLRIGQLSVWAKRMGRYSGLSRFNMATAIDPVIERLEWRIAERGARLAKPDSWPDILGDPAMCEDIWRMLLGNVLRHGGKFTKVEVGWVSEGAGVRFFLQNDGPGVPPEKQSTLFYPFYRMHEPDACTGLDLPIVADLVSMQRGQCGFEEPKPGVTRFWFSLNSGTLSGPGA